MKNVYQRTIQNHTLGSTNVEELVVFFHFYPFVYVSFVHGLTIYLFFSFTQNTFIEHQLCIRHCLDTDSHLESGLG